MVKLLFCLMLPCFLGGCAAEADNADRNFFYSGWRHPKEWTDQQSPRPRPGAEQTDF